MLPFYSPNHYEERSDYGGCSPTSSVLNTSLGGVREHPPYWPLLSAVFANILRTGENFAFSTNLPREQISNFRPRPTSLVANFTFSTNLPREQISNFRPRSTSLVANFTISTESQEDELNRSTPGIVCCEGQVRWMFLTFEKFNNCCTWHSYAYEWKAFREMIFNSTEDVVCL